MRNFKALLDAADLEIITALRMVEFQQRRVRAVSAATVDRETSLLKHMFNIAERWDSIRVRIPSGGAKFLPEDNLQFQTTGEENRWRLLESSPPLFPEADRLRD